MSVGSSAHGLYAMLGNLYQAVVSSHPCLSSGIDDDGVCCFLRPLDCRVSRPAVQSLLCCHPYSVFVYCDIPDEKVTVLSTSRALGCCSSCISR